MASLSTLNSQLRSLQSQLGNAENALVDAKDKRDKAKKRRDAVKTIKKDLEGDFDNNCRDINRVADQMESDVGKGLKGISNASTLDANIGADKEVMPEYETNLSTAHQALEDEYNELDRFYEEKKNEVERLKGQISSLKWNITCKKNEIRAEEARLAYEAHQRALAELAAKLANKDK